MEKIYTFTPQQAGILEFITNLEKELQALLPEARRALSIALEFDSDTAYSASFGTLVSIESLIEQYKSLFESSAARFASDAGITAEPGALWSLKGNTISVLAAPAVDPLAEVSSLSGPALLSHEKYPELVNTAKQIFRDAAFEFAAANPGQVSPGEVADTVAFIENFSDAAIADTRPVAAGVSR